MEIGERDGENFGKLWKRINVWDSKRYITDGYYAYAKFPLKETKLSKAVENNNIKLPNDVIMPLDFSGQNLRGRSFKGSDLTGADFSYADIRSTDFTGTILRETKFCHAKAGLQRRWAIVIVIGLCLLAGLSGFFSGFTGAMGIAIDI